jgi:hypothetical protein
MLLFRLLVSLKDEVDGRGMRELRGAAEAAVLDVEKLGDGFDLRVDDAEIEIGETASARELAARSSSARLLR